MNLRLGILIIGSLYWDDNLRANWRKERLDIKSEEKVYAPIRYGRKSTSRNNTYTMVFSRECLEMHEGMGQAIIIPVKKLATSSNDVIKEAQILWGIESNNNQSKDICSNWGAVAILPNPSSENSQIIRSWNNYVNSINNYGNLDSSQNENPAINDNGLLNIPWPLSINKKLSRVDLILATATNPTLDMSANKYPTVKEIAYAWNADPEGNVSYFWKNRKYGITTFQDEQIIRELKKYE